LAAGDANTDVIQVMYSGSDFFAGRGIKIKDEGGAGDLRTITESGIVYTTSALSAGDLALIVQGTSCIIVQVNGVPAADRITRVAGTWNEGGNFNRGLTFGDPAVGGVPGVLYSLGSQERFVMRAFAIRGGRLTVCSPLVQNCAVATQWQPVADGIVSLRAELGVDTTNDDVADTWTLSAPAAWEDAKAIRIALVARGQHRERDAIANADCTPSWAGNDNDSPSPSRTCPGTGAALAATDRRIVLNSVDTPDAAAWAQYRHRVVQTTIALRNAFWSNN
jgi:hypothetical protein